MTMNTLEKICATKGEHINTQKEKTSLDVLKQQIQKQEPPRGFLQALKKQAAEGIAHIAEVKKASPSKGVIRENFNPIDIAKTYEESGATCLSVLTDEPYFQGCDQYLKDIKKCVDLPILRKDFIIDPYQVFESRAIGADCILLIMACLSDQQARDLYATAIDLGMDILVEVHDQTEMERALKLSPMMIGVNNRNLKTLEVNHQTGLVLAEKITKNIFAVAESGLYTHKDVQTFKQHGYNGFLIGESLMREDNIANATRRILGKE